MTIHVKPHLEAVLKAQVDAGNFSDVEAALEAAILGLESDDIERDDDEIASMKPLLDEAEADVAAGRTVPADEVWARIERRIKAR